MHIQIQSARAVFGFVVASFSLYRIVSFSMVSSRWQLAPTILTVGEEANHQLELASPYPNPVTEIDHGNIANSNIIQTVDSFGGMIHVIWGCPNATSDRSYNNKPRAFDNSSFTGCCDSLIELSLRSYTTVMPDRPVWLWNLGGWDAKGFVEKKGLKVEVKEFDPTVEYPNDPVLQEVYNGLISVVPKSDLARYTLMRNYGGSYIDLDGVMVRPLDNVTRINISPFAPKVPTKLVCNGIDEPRDAGRCVLSNGAFLNFPPRHRFFNVTLDVIRKEKRTCGGTTFFCYGPQWFTNNIVNDGILNPEVVDVKPTVALRNQGAYQSHRSVFLSHWDFDVADNCDSSPVLNALCKKFGVAR